MPPRHHNLFDRIANFQALYAAAKRAVKGKRKKPSAAAFFANLEGELLAWSDNYVPALIGRVGTSRSQSQTRKNASSPRRPFEIGSCITLFAQS